MVQPVSAPRIGSVPARTIAPPLLHGPVLSTRQSPSAARPRTLCAVSRVMSACGAAALGMKRRVRMFV